MALVACGLIPMPVPFLTESVNVPIIDAANEMIWNAHVVTRSGGGTITHVWFRTDAVTVGETLDVRLESGDANDAPSGNLWAANTNAAQVVLSTNDQISFRTALTAGAVVALGDIIFPMAKLPAVSSANMKLVGGSGGGYGGLLAFPYTGGPLATDRLRNRFGVFSLEYSDGYIEYCPMSMPHMYNLGNTTLQSTGSFDEAGLLFTTPITCRTVGWWLHAYGTPGTTARRVALYALGNNTPLATSTISASQFPTNGQNNALLGAWDSVTEGIILSAGSTYRVSLVVTGTDAQTLSGFTADEGNRGFDLLGFPGAQITKRNRASGTDPDSATWTETATIRPQMGLILDQLDDGVQLYGPPGPSEGLLMNSNRWILDTPGGVAITTLPQYVRSILWEGTGLIAGADQVIITDANDEPIFSARAKDAVVSELHNIDAWWHSGFKLPTLDGGTLIITVG